MVFLLAAAGSASAGTCNNPAPPYEVPAQNSVVNLDIDCAGAGGIVEVIGTVNGNAGHALSDASGNEANWAIVVDSGGSAVTSDLLSTIDVRSPGASVENYGSIEQTGNGRAIHFIDNAVGSAGSGLVTNRSLGEISSVSSVTIDFDAGGELVNESNATIRNAGGTVVGAGGFLQLTNFGTIETLGAGAISAISGNGGATVANYGVINGRLNFFSSGTLTINNGGTMTGHDGYPAIRVGSSVPAFITTSGLISAGAGSVDAMTLASGDDLLKLRPGYSIIGNVLAGGGVDGLVLTGLGDGDFNLDDFGAQYQDFEVIQIGSGHWTLTGTSLFSGSTEVTTSGTAVIDGILGGSLHTLAASNGTTLAGSGTIGGTVSMADATLSPGTGAGTLTVEGDLTLGSGSVLSFELDQPGGDNDSLTVNGDLMLDGTLQVSDLGGFGEGVYTLIEYTGTLTDNTLEPGSLPALPAGLTASIDTEGVAGEVNLVIAPGTGPLFSDRFEL